MPSKWTICAVLTCYNRKAKTQACLENLYRAAECIADRVRLHVIVTDDGSTDGTAEMLRTRFPEVEVMRGDGSLFWNGGMRVAFGRALEESHDFYLWVNDDSNLLPDCLAQLLATHDTLMAQYGRGGIVVGSMCNDQGTLSYGGQRRNPGWKALSYSCIEPGDTPLPCETFHGNCVLVSTDAVRELGNLDAAFKHGMGDMDYGLRATRQGIPIWVMPGYAGRCIHDHTVEGSYLDRSLPLVLRWKKALSPKELSPRAWGVYCRRHAGSFWPVYWVWPYAKIVVTSLIHRRMRSGAIAILLLGLPGFFLANSLFASTNIGPSPGPLPAKFFGLHLHRADSTTSWPLVRFGSWRLWDAGIDWRAIEPVRGQWRFEKLDRLMALAEENNVEPVFVFGVTPQWASARPNEPFVYGAGGAAEPRDLRDWENFVRTVAMRYKGRIRHFEMWNEPKYADIEPVTGSFYTGTLASLVQLGCSAYRVLKEVDPNNKLLTPGFTGAGDRLDRFLAAGGKGCSDIVAFHFYTATPEQMLKRIQEVKEIMRKQGIADRPLWNTEQGYDIVGPNAKIPGNSGFGVRDMATQAAYIPRAFVLAAAAGIDRFFFYSWERLLIEKETLPSVGATALAMTVRWLKGATIESCITQDSAVWVCSLSRGERKTWIVWSTWGESSWTVPKSWQVTAFESADGRAGKIPGNVIKIEKTPLLLKRETLI